MHHFVPSQVFVQPDALAYPATRQTTSKLKQLGVPITVTSRVPAAGRELSPAERYREAKRTFSLRVRAEKYIQQRLLLRPAIQGSLPFCHRVHRHRQCLKLNMVNTPAFASALTPSI